MKQQLINITVKCKILIFAITLYGCGSTPLQNTNPADISDPLKRVSAYRQMLTDAPENQILMAKLNQAQRDAAEYYLSLGYKSVENGNTTMSITQFERGLIAMPTNRKLADALTKALNRREAEHYHMEAKRFEEAGKYSDAIQSLKKATELAPDNHQAATLLNILTERTKPEDTIKVIPEKEIVTLNFNRINLRDALEFIGKSTNINVVMDEDLRNTPVTIYAENVSWRQALDIITQLTQSFYRNIGPNSIIVAPDTKDKRDKYEDQMIKVFTLKSISAKEMVSIIKSLLSPNKIVANETSNSIMVRDVPETLNLIQKLIQANDTQPAEIILAVEIIEINRSKAERLGIDYGSYEFKLAHSNISTAGSLETNLSQAGTLSIPSIAYRFFKQEVDARTLASPKIRVINHSSAKIHIGDKVPLRSSTVQEATGQVRTTFDYQDVGIRLQVEPTIHLNNSTTVKLNLEVSTLGENLGTTDEPAYRIGTRNAETIMHLRDGETAILGGLIRDEERNTEVKIPGLGSIPAVGSLFRANNNDGSRIDVLLTITPRLVRPAELPSESSQEFYSGNNKRNMDKSIFARTQVPVEIIRVGKQAVEAKPTAQASSTKDGNISGEEKNLPSESNNPKQIDSKEKLDKNTIKNKTEKNALILPDKTLPDKTKPSAQDAPKLKESGTTQKSSPTEIATLYFDQPAYSAGINREFTITVMADDLNIADELTFELLFDNNLLDFKQAKFTGRVKDEATIESNSLTGAVKIKAPLKENNGDNKTEEVLTVTLKGKKAGVAYLVFKTPTLSQANGEQTYARVRAARVTIQ